MVRKSLPCVLPLAFGLGLISGVTISVVLIGQDHLLYAVLETDHMTLNLALFKIRCES